MWFTATTISTTHGGKLFGLAPQVVHQFDHHTASTDHQSNQLTPPIVENLPLIDHHVLPLCADKHHQ
jgi:hypothetical protein